MTRSFPVLLSYLFKPQVGADEQVTGPVRLKQVNRIHQQAVSL